MKHYYYADNEQQLGPFTIEELKSKRLKKTTLVWTDGMPDWTPADEFEELKDILISGPPPLPKKSNASPAGEPVQIKQTPILVTSSKYDQTYTKEDDATVLGVILFIIPIAFTFIPFKTEEDYSRANAFIAIGALVIRIAVIVGVVNISTRQNRNSTAWGWFAFFLPSIALIIIGQLKKLRLKIALDENLSITQQVAILQNKAIRFYGCKRDSECIEILNKAIQLDNKNYKLLKLRGLVHYRLGNLDKCTIDFEKLNRAERYPAITNYYLGNLAMMNINREIAVAYWLKAKELNNPNAMKKLNLYHHYSGKYLLDSSEVAKKLTEDGTFYFRNGEYNNGLSEIDSLENFNTAIRGYANGLRIELIKKFKTYYIAIAFYEINNIIFNEAAKQFELHLLDKCILRFTYDQSKDDNQGLKKFCNKFKTKTGITPAALSCWTRKKVSYN
ncbi:MAG TPA: DUF4339 domain-containing protein [Bacteroidia bacterium]|nr:DUF4339 domain-containing protein [Bacteroidia bacterium]